MKKEEKNEEWDIRRILITLFFLVVCILVVLEVKRMLLPNAKILPSSKDIVVEVKKPDLKPPVNVQSAVDSKISQIKDSISGIDAEEIATSSPQIQKVLRDIQGIKNLPADKAKDQCLKICSGL
jgi:hypothetical protein